MKKTFDFILRVMKAVNSEYRLVLTATGYCEILPTGDAEYPFAVHVNQTYTPSKHMAFKSLKSAYDTIKEGVYYVGYNASGKKVN